MRRCVCPLGVGSIGGRHLRGPTCSPISGRQQGLLPIPFRISGVGRSQIVWGLGLSVVLVHNFTEGAVLSGPSDELQMRRGLQLG